MNGKLPKLPPVDDFVCEEHPDQPWLHKLPDGTTCTCAGMPPPHVHQWIAHPDPEIGLTCKKCGMRLSEKPADQEKVTKAIEAARRLVRCADEFWPEYPGALGEYWDELFTAIDDAFGD